MLPGRGLRVVVGFAPGSLVNDISLGSPLPVGFGATVDAGGGDSGDEVRTVALLALVGSAVAEGASAAFTPGFLGGASSSGMTCKANRIPATIAAPINVQRITVARAGRKSGIGSLSNG